MTDFLGLIGTFILLLGTIYTLVELRAYRFRHRLSIRLRILSIVDDRD